MADTLRSAEYPAPATELAVQIDHAVVVVQELLPGAKIDDLDHRGLEQAIELNRLQTGRLADRLDIPPVGLHLREEGPGYCQHEPLRRHSDRSAALERWITAVGEDTPDQLVGRDAVHYDFHPGNILAAGGAITGIVDWDGAGRGDRRFDPGYVALRHPCEDVRTRHR